MTLLDLLRKVAASPQLMAIVRATVVLEPEDQVQVLKYLNDLNETGDRTERRSHRV